MATTLADVIDRAINEYLWNGVDDDQRGKDAYSCNAVNSAYFAYVDYELTAANFLMSLGCKNETDLFDEFQSGPQRQYARALWLTWAALIAREEGL